MDMTRDGYHMDYGISRYAASCAVFEKLISPAFGGVTLDGNPFRYTTSNTTHGSYSTPVTEANAPIALQAARYALTTPYAVTDMFALRIFSSLFRGYSSCFDKGVSLILQKK